MVKPLILARLMRTPLLAKSHFSRRQYFNFFMKVFYV
jgi:hypothetical protein